MEKLEKSPAEMVWIRIDDRTHIEVPADMTKEERKARIDNSLKNSKFKPIKGLL